MIWILTNCFNNERALEIALDRFHKTTDLEGLRYRGIVFDSRYPLTTGGALQTVAARHGFDFIDLGTNHGQSGNFNLIRKIMLPLLEDDDMVVFWDCDHAPRPVSWLKSFCEIMASDPKVQFLTAHRKPGWVLSNQGELLARAGHQARVLCWPGGWPMGVYAGKFIRAYELPVLFPHYGGTEHDILTKLQSTGNFGLMTTDIEDDMTALEFDPLYLAWKAEEIGKVGQKGFREWLLTRGIEVVR